MSAAIVAMIVDNLMENRNKKENVMNFKEAMGHMIDGRICIDDSSCIRYRFHDNELQYYIPHSNRWKKSFNFIKAFTRTNWTLDQRIIIIDNKEIKLSEESYQALKKSLLEE